VLITLGHLSIGLSGFAQSKTPFFLGLILIVLGTGLLKPNISAIVGDLYPEGGARATRGSRSSTWGSTSARSSASSVAGASARR
jgi:POT family proton-dependent oligopeptide transporter